jgi:hypothetical protein
MALFQLRVSINSSNQSEILPVPFMCKGKSTKSFYINKIKVFLDLIF